MVKQAQSTFLKLERDIAKDEHGGVMHRGRYGDEILKKRAGRQRLPKGLLTDIVIDALRAGYTISEREIQRRVRFAEVYPTDAHRRQALALMGSWSAIAEAGFPSVELDETDEEVDEIEDLAVPEPPEGFTADPLFDIPGFKPVLRINGRKRDLADVTVRDAIAYRDMCEDMHANFGRTVAQIKASVELMVAGAAGNLDANAVEAWRRATSPTAE
jgi:hypothetical protein